ncbi:gem-associated protein 8 isoform X1 [Petromyzon marinus]|uniref:gem-associated protein 8 isoform X1 n=1 Tax=Petromyzon marinus TaxID=7757 RepID=UPI003F714A79
MAVSGNRSRVARFIAQRSATRPLPVTLWDKRLQEEATAATGGSAWYAHPVYARYWSHYRDAQAWTRRHQNARRRALTEAAQGLDWSSLVGLPFPYDPSHPYAASHHGPQSHPPCLGHNHCSAQAAGHRRRHHQQQHDHYHQQQHHHQKHEEMPEHHHFSSQATEHQRDHQQHQHYHHNQQRQHWQQQLIDEVPDLRSEEPDEDSDPESESESEAESDVEITDELRAYFAETERHREERRLEQEQEDERAEGMVWADEPPGTRQASSLAPQERPGERRRVEMARLYGEEACVRILALEAAMQLSFDQHCDRTRPKYWPIIPLKL